MTGITLRLSKGRVVARHFHGMTDVLRALTKDLFDPYRPERHYMRGPGPKWRAKHRSQVPARALPTQVMAWSTVSRRISG